MRVLHVIKSLEVGGAEVMAVELAHQQRQMGITSSIASSGGALAPQPPHHHVIPEPSVTVQAFSRSIRGLRKVLASVNPDLVHAHNPGAALLSRLSSIGGPILVTMHGHSERALPRIGKAMRLIRVPIVACSPGLAASFSKAGVQVSEITNGVADNPSDAFSRSAARQSLRLEGDRTVVFQVARLEKVKNHLLTLKAAQRLDDFHFVFIGAGSEEDNIRQHIQAMGLGSRVTLLGERTDVRKFLSAADVVLLTSDHEGLGLTLIEAQMAGVPVVSSDTVGASGIIENLHNGIIFPRNSVSGLTRSLRRLDDPSLREELSRNGRLSSRGYGAEVMAAKYVEAYQQLLWPGAGTPLRGRRAR